MLRPFTAGLLLLPLGGVAAEAVTNAPAPSVATQAGSGMAAQLGQLAVGLLLVVGLIFLLAWLLRRVQQLGPRGGQVIQLVATQALGPRDRLVLVQVGGEQILLGISAGRITPLHVLKDPVQPAGAQAASPEFAQRLMELLGKDKH
ncbi:flagellar biosynthetic protein FliO [Pseudomonas sp. GCM10022186]|uniref:flagellar biosynthetic protein FliO n=1 Tax=Pseudomonas sp. GCM10022186 TaxID=3252650 RepID=UPI003609F492